MIKKMDGSLGKALHTSKSITGLLKSLSPSLRMILQSCFEHELTGNIQMMQALGHAYKPFSQQTQFWERSKANSLNHTPLANICIVVKNCGFYCTPIDETCNHGNHKYKQFLAVLSSRLVAGLRQSCKHIVIHGTVLPARRSCAISENVDTAIAGYQLAHQQQSLPHSIPY